MREDFDVAQYRRSWDPTRDVWTKRGDAADFALFLAGELGINAKGCVVERDGKDAYRVYVPLFSAYWTPPEVVAMPIGSLQQTWADHLRWFKLEARKWANSP